MATAQPSKRTREPAEHVNPPSSDFSESKKRQRSPEKFDRDSDRQKRPRRDGERRDDRREGENERHGGDRDRRERDRHDRDRRDRDVDRPERDGRGQGRHDRDRRGGDTRNDGKREPEKRDRDRDMRNGERNSPLPASTSNGPPSGRQQHSGAAPTSQNEGKAELVEPEEEEAALMRRVMGFASFKSTKNTKVPGNDKLYGVRKEKKTEYRQYMNRVGGFNRPLSPSR